MLKASVHCTRIDLIRPGKLPNPSQPLISGLRNDLPFPIIQGHKSMNGAAKFVFVLMFGKHDDFLLRIAAFVFRRIRFHIGIINYVAHQLLEYFIERRHTGQVPKAIDSGLRLHFLG